MRKNYQLLMAVLVCFAVSSCNSDKTEQEGITKTETQTLDKQWAKSLIDSLNTKFSQEINSGDSMALAGHYWPDAELLLDNMDVVKGKDIENAWGTLLRMGIKELNLSSTDITGSPAFIIETGKYEMKDEKKSLLDEGKYVVVWEKRNNEWKIYRDIACTSKPPAK